MTHKERQREANRKWRAANRDRVREYGRKWREANPERHKAYRDAWRAKNYDYTLVYNAKWKREKRAKLKRLNTLVAADESRMAVLMRNELYAAARAAMPVGLPAHIRDDVVSDIVLAVLEGELALGQVAAKAGDYLKAYNRLFDARKHVSLDEGRHASLTM